jgi:hypothetical protein
MRKRKIVIASASGRSGERWVYYYFLREVPKPWLPSPAYEHTVLWLETKCTPYLLSQERNRAWSHAHGVWRALGGSY